MKYKIIGLFIVTFFIILASAMLIHKSSIKSPKSNQLTNLRIGWQVPWATQGQLTQILKHTDILEKNNLKAEFKGFTFGGPLNEAALAGEVDIIFTADQPVATLISKNPDWVIIGRLMYNRVSLYVPPQSPIKNISDLKGKTVGMPFGAAAQRMALQAEKNAGLDPKTDINNVNLDIYEQSDLVRDPNATKWGEMDALAGFDPTPAIFEEKKLIRNLSVGKVVSVIVMSKKYITKNPTAPKDFLTAYKSAYLFYRANINQANQWFTEESKLNITPKSLEIAAGIEPNLQVSSDEDVRLGFTEDDFKILQEAADFIYDQSLIKKRITMRNHIDLTYLNAANIR